MFSKSLVILLAAFSCVNALATPHHVRSTHHHRAIAHAARAPVARNVSGVAPASKRSLRKRCRNRPVTSSLVQADLASSSAAPTTSSTQVEAQPTSTTEQAPSSTQVEVQPTSTTEQAPPPPPTTSSTQAEPTSTTEQAPPPPTTSSTQQQQPTTTSQEQSQPTQGNDNNNNGNSNNNSGNSGNNSGLSFLSGTQTGEATFYNTGLTACGTTKSDSDAIVAVSMLLFDVFPGANGNPNLNPICGKKVRATYQGKSVDLEVQDRCVGCALTDLDMTPTAFQQLAPLGDGRLQGMTWVWI